MAIWSALGLKYFIFFTRTLVNDLARYLLSHLMSASYNWPLLCVLDFLDFLGAFFVCSFSLEYFAKNELETRHFNASQKKDGN